MASAVWVGTDSGNEGDVNTAANWSPSGVPGSGDDIYFTGGSQDVDTNLATLTAVNVASINVGPDYTGNIGADGSPLEVANCTTIRFRGGGSECWLQAEMVTTVQVLGGISTANMLHLEGGSLAITNVEVTDALGTVSLDAGTVVDLRMFGCPSTCIVDVDSGCTISGDVLADSGTLYLGKASGIDDLRAVGTAAITIEDSAGAITSTAVLHISGEASLYYNNDGNCTGVVEVWGSGEVNCRGNITPATVTFAAVNAHNGGTFDKRSGLANIAVTSENSFEGNILPEI